MWATCGHTQKDEGDNIKIMVAKSMVPFGLGGEVTRERMGLRGDWGCVRGVVAV